MFFCKKNYYNVFPQKLSSSIIFNINNNNNKIQLIFEESIYNIFQQNS